MPQVINTNIPSLNAQRNLNVSGQSLAQTLQRLSSGLRINSAKDDAAGLAISDRFTTQIRGLNQAIRNANDGISLAQTGEGALAEITNNLQRIRELAVQAVNATNSTSDRAALDLEVQQRLAEVDRISAQTSFNGQRILDGTFGSAVFQVGANVGETIGINLQTSTRNNAIGVAANATSGDLSAVIIPPSAAVPATTATSGALGVFAPGGIETGGANSYTYTLNLNDGTNNVNVADTVAASGTGSIATFAAALDAVFAADGSTVSGFTISYGGDPDSTTALTNGNLSFSRADGVNFTVSEGFTGAGTPTTNAGFAGVANVGGLTTTDGVAAVPPNAGTPLTLATGDFTIQIGTQPAVSVVGTFTTIQQLADGINSSVNGTYADVVGNTVRLRSSEDITIGGAQGLGALGYAAANLAAGNLTSVSVSTVDLANEAILRVDSALTQVSNLRSTFGAIQNRFQSTINNLQTTSENLSASRSRILDADFAAETAELTRTQILQQAGTAILAQANQLPQNVLSLLQ